MKKVVLGSVVSLCIGTIYANAEWVDVSKKVCINNGGYMKNGVCSAYHSNTVSICKAVNAIVPNSDELGDVITKCGGTFDSGDNSGNQMYQSCRKEKGFLIDDGYWSSSRVAFGFADYPGVVDFQSGALRGSTSGATNYIRCLRP